MSHVRPVFQLQRLSARFRGTLHPSIWREAWVISMTAAGKVALLDRVLSLPTGLIKRRRWHLNWKKFLLFYRRIGIAGFGVSRGEFQVELSINSG